MNPWGGPALRCTALRGGFFMKEESDLPEIGLIAGTRVALGNRRWVTPCQ